MVMYKISKGLEIFLNPQNDCPYIGKEKVLSKHGRITTLISETGDSYRYLYYLKGRCVAAMQVMVDVHGQVIVANMFTRKVLRGQGYMTALYERVQDHHAKIYFSTNRSEDAKHFLKKARYDGLNH